MAVRPPLGRAVGTLPTITPGATTALTIRGKIALARNLRDNFRQLAKHTEICQNLRLEFRAQLSHD